MNTECEFHSDALVRQAAGRLDPVRAERLRAHLEACPDCREELRIVRTLKAAPAPVPAGLEARLRQAVIAAATPGAARTVTAGAAPRAGTRPERSDARRWEGMRSRWRLVAAPLVAAAAVVVVWLGVDARRGPAPGDVVQGLAAVAEYEPYGAWPAVDGVVAGDPVLSDLSVDELERLLEEMQR